MSRARRLPERGRRSRRARGAAAGSPASAAQRTGFQYIRRVQFAETDLAGVVHFSWFVRYIEEAEHALWREAGLTIAPPDRSVGFPRVSFTIDYHAPLHFEDVFEVWIRLTQLTARTLTYASAIYCGPTHVATATHTAVCVDPRTRPLRAIALPAEIRARLTPFVANRPL